MSFRGEQFNKCNGVTYIYLATSVWNVAKQRSEQKRIYIGKKAPLTGEFIPNKKYFELYGEDGQPKQAEGLTGPTVVMDMSSYEYGNIYALQKAADNMSFTVIRKYIKQLITNADEQSASKIRGKITF